MDTGWPREKLKQMIGKCIDHRGVTLLKKQTSRATLTAVLLGGFTMEIVKTGLPALLGAGGEHTKIKLTAYTAGLTGTIVINLFYETLGDWLTEAKEEVANIEAEAVQEERTVKEKIREIEEAHDKKLGRKDLPRKDRAKLSGLNRITEIAFISRITFILSVAIVFSVKASTETASTIREKIQNF